MTWKRLLAQRKSVASTPGPHRLHFEAARIERRAFLGLPTTQWSESVSF